MPSMSTLGPYGPPSSPRPLVLLAPAAKVCLLLAALLVLLAVYFLFVPLHVDSSTGPPFECSRAVTPPTAQFATNSCGRINEVYQMRAGGSFLAALFVGGGGMLFFGVNRRRIERKGVAPPAD